MRTITVVVGVVLCIAPAASAQRVYIAPVSDFALGDAGPTRFEYLTEFGRQEACQTVHPTNRRDQADFEVWFEFEQSLLIASEHFMVVWNPEGSVVAMGTAVLSENIVADACEAMVEAVRREQYGPPVGEYTSCEALRGEGWSLGLHQDGGTYQDPWDNAERETYALNVPLDRNADGLICPPPDGRSSPLR